MSKVINPFARPIVLPTGHIVPAGGELVTTNSVLNCTDNLPTIQALARSGQATVEYDPEPLDEFDDTPAKVVEANPEVQKVADTLDLLAESASPSAPKPPRAPAPRPTVLAASVKQVDAPEPPELLSPSAQTSAPVKG